MTFWYEKHKNKEILVSRRFFFMLELLRVFSKGNFELQRVGKFCECCLRVEFWENKKKQDLLNFEIYPTKKTNGILKTASLERFMSRNFGFLTSSEKYKNWIQIEIKKVTNCVDATTTKICF